MPVVMDFSPIGDLAKTFFDARDAALDRKLKRAQLEAPGEWAKIVAEGQGSPSLAPSSPDMTPVSSLGQPSQGKLPTFAAMQGAEPSANLKTMFTDKERQYALPPGYLSQTAAIESRFNPNAQNPNSSAGGLFQFTDGTAKTYGLSNKYDPAASTDAAARLAADNRAYLSKVLGREPTAGELYLAHQQGAGGAAKLLTNPNARAVDVVGADAVRLNGGDANMTTAEFASRWTSKVDGPRSAQPARSGQTGVASAGASEDDNLRAIIANPMTPPNQKEWAQQQLAGRGASSATATADLPAPGAKETQYVIPGQSSAPAQAATPPMLQIPAGLQAAMNSPNPYVRQMAAKRVEALQDAQRQFALKQWERQQETKTVDLGTEVGVMDGSGNIVRRIPKQAAEKWSRLNENTLFSPGTGETKPIEGQGGGMFKGNSVEAQSLNHLVQTGKLTPEQAAQIGAGKTVTAPDGSILFMTPQGIFSTPPQGGAQAAPQASAPSSQAVPQPGTQTVPNPLQPSQAPASAQTRPGMIAVTPPKPVAPEKTTEDQNKNRQLYSESLPQLQIAEQNFDGLTKIGEGLGSKLPLGDFLTSEEYQRANNAVKNIVANYLYSVSGATASPQEVEIRASLLMPRPGEKPGAIADKKDRIRQMVEGIKQRAAYAPGKEPGTSDNDGWVDVGGVKIRRKQ